MKILCVCLGNICRSPLAETVIRAKAKAAGLEVTVDSAAIENWHVDQTPDPRTIAAATKHGYSVPEGRARQIAPGDLTAYDLILAMDASNVAALRRMAPSGGAAQIRLFHHAGLEILDPYHDGQAVFDRVLDMIEHAADTLIAELAQ